MLVALSLFVGLALGAKDAEYADLGSHLDFVERNVLNLLRLGDYPQLYNSSFPKLKQCGCHYSPTKITFGSRVGLQCQRMFTDEKPPPLDEDNCGLMCNSPHNMDIVLFCPYGWDSDCARGCFPPDEFENVGERIDFWELTLTSLLMHGSEYINVQSDYLEACGCDGKVRPIRYGTQVGFDCLLKKDARPDAKKCSGHSACADDQGRQIMTFCPAGHRPSCQGCEKVMEGDDYKARLNWMINVVTGYTRESLDVLQWTPTTQQLIDCSCAKGVEKVTYGTQLGYYCQVRNVNDINSNCGPNVLCKDGQNKDILHFCPDGFLPSCTEGCRFPWKEEL